MEFSIYNMEVEWSLGFPRNFVRHPLFAKYGLECWSVSFYRKDKSLIQYDALKNNCSILGDRFNFETTVPYADKVVFLGKLDLALVEEIMTCAPDKLAYYLTSPSITSRTLASLRYLNK